MARILIIDDEPIYHKMIAHALKPLGYEMEFAEDGQEGLKIATTKFPDLIICDVVMPKLNGYELTRILRRDPHFAQTPILILTGQSQLEEKIEAFKAGADDHLTKPFEPAELIVRIGAMLRRTEALKGLQAVSRTTTARLVGVQSLRGGVGCSTMATNLAVALSGIWESPTLLMDLVLSAGQVALMLNGSLKRTWADVSRFDQQDMDADGIRSIIGKHDSGVNYIASPAFISDGELLTTELFKNTFELLKNQFDYVVADLPHDINEITLQFLDAAHDIILLMAPELASVRAASSALDAYNKLGYPPEKIKLVLNWTFERRGLQRKQIEAALHRNVELVLPFVPDLTIEAINYGKPLLYNRPEESISILIEDFAYGLSKQEDKVRVPVSPSRAWQRINKRIRDRGG